MHTTATANLQHSTSGVAPCLGLPPSQTGVACVLHVALQVPLEQVQQQQSQDAVEGCTPEQLRADVHALKSELDKSK